MSVNEGEVYFRLSGDNFDPDVASKEIGLQATRTRKKGIPIPKTSCWEFSSGKVIGEILDIYEMSSALVAQLSPKAESISSLIKTHELAAVLQVVLRITMDDTKSTPAIGFDTDTLSFLCSVGASIDVDTYRNES